MFGSDGEFMQPARAVQHYGIGFMEAIRQLKLPKYASGGIVGVAVANLSPVPKTTAGIGASGDTYYLQLPNGGQVGPLQAQPDVGAKLRHLFAQQARKQGRSKS